MTILITSPNSKPKLVSYNSSAGKRLVRIVDAPADPIIPPKFKHRRHPRPAGPPPVPVLHSPPRPLTVKDQHDWRVPPCISNWKNSKGYVIPLDKRLACHGRGLQEFQINSNFSALSEALYVSEQAAREAVELRSKLRRELELREREKKEKELRELAQKARSSHLYHHTGETMKQQFNERKRSALMATKGKAARDRERDISEKVALGMASNSIGAGHLKYDERLFNQDSGLDSGFVADDRYNVCDKGLFVGRSALSSLYRPKRERAPVEFPGEEGSDPFELDYFFAQLKKGKTYCS